MISRDWEMIFLHDGDDEWVEKLTEIGKFLVLNKKGINISTVYFNKQKNLSQKKRVNLGKNGKIEKSLQLWMN